MKNCNCSIGRRLVSIEVICRFYKNTNKQIKTLKKKERDYWDLDKILDLYNEDPYLATDVYLEDRELAKTHIVTAPKGFKIR